MKKKVEQYMKQWKMISPGDMIIAGVSGGADSVCLLVLLDMLRKEWDFSLTVVHVNHGLRGEEAQRDEEFVKSFCKGLDVPCAVTRANVRKLAGEWRCSEEEAGRMVRRQAYEEAVRKYGGNRIALAHQQDDNVETFLLNAARGSRLKGLGGIYPVKGLYIRPLLCVSRREILDFLEERNLPFCTDSTNEEDEYTRNRIRHHVIPLLEREVHAGAVSHISSAMEYLREVEAYLERQEEAACRNCLVKEKGQIRLLQQPWEELEPLIGDRVLQRALVLAAGKARDIGAVHVESLGNLLRGQTGKRLSLPYSVEGVKGYGEVVLGKKQETAGTKRQEAEKETVLPVKAQPQGSLRAGKLQISWRVFPRPEILEGIPKKTYTKWFDYGIIKDNISIRTRMAGDRIAVDREGHRQKLKSFFINEKIPAEERNSIPLLAEGPEILWIIGYRQGSTCQVTQETSVILEITILGGAEHGRED